MSKIIAICGKICSGKTYYSNLLKQKNNAVVLSCDEITKQLFNNNLGNKHDEITKKIKQYFLEKSIEIIKANCDVILDWGFWTCEERAFIKNFYKEKNIKLEIHYIEIDDVSWHKNIDERNKKIELDSNSTDFYLDEGLMQKLLLLWQTPTQEEFDVCFTVKR